MKQMETDHEFKTRMAAEGKAIYTPGKTVEQVKADLRGEKLTLEIHEGDLKQMHEDAQEVEDTLFCISQAAEYLSRTATEECPGMGAVLELMGRATNLDAAPCASRLIAALRTLDAVEDKGQS